MTIWTIVPVKPLRLGKSRLSGVLSDDERAVLNRIFLEQTLETLRNTPEVGQTLVVSRDPAALAIAREYGARTVLEDGNPDLNQALDRATLLARNYASRGVLVLPADLPLLTGDDLHEFFEHLFSPPCVVIAPDRREDGTNAMLMTPGGLIPYSFGPGSFNRHCNLTRERGARLDVVRNANIALDLDTPEDLELLKQSEKYKI
ncbi:MAG: 2-phospho-L-lactate guanylyltransferase [Chloroflexi bacterium]|nr:MAG: 2-phospho-L-lactate guanylyltransferase [Chloroflexota bacterium]